MLNLDPILVPFDGSSYARAAAALARKLGEPTILLHVVGWPDPLFGDADRVDARHLAEARALLQGEAGRFTTPVEVRVMEGDPGPAVRAEIRSADPGLVILGSRGRSALAERFLGTVSREILRDVTHPTLFVHGEMDPVRTVVACVDQSPKSIRVATAARTLAERLGAPLRAVTVVEADIAMARNPEAYGIPLADWEEMTLARTEAVFGPLRDILGPGVPEDVQFGIADEELRRYVTGMPNTILVLGRRGEKGIDTTGWFSVAFALAARGPHATLVV